VLHGKMSVCDDWVSVGSSNLDRWSFKWNLEANQEIDSALFSDIAAAVSQGRRASVGAWAFPATTPVWPVHNAVILVDGPSHLRAGREALPSPEALRHRDSRSSRSHSGDVLARGQ